MDATPKNAAVETAVQADQATQAATKYSVGFNWEHRMTVIITQTGLELPKEVPVPIWVIKAAAARILEREAKEELKG
jgi:hypothetical protein